MITQPPSSADFDPRQALFDGLPVPVCLVDGSGRLVALNRRALAFWALEPGALVGRPAMEALGIMPADGGGDAWGRLSAPDARPYLTCRITTVPGQTSPASVMYTAVDLERGTPSHGAIFIIEGAAAAALADVPEWALRDPVTGLGNRRLWEREMPRWSARSGCVVFLDLDDLKEVNDLHGHLAGDRLLSAAGQALASISPPEALTVRYGGDEFVIVLPDPDEAAAEAWALRAVGQVAFSAASANLPIVLRLSHGVAAFGPGGLRDAVQGADDRLYERKGVLLSAATGGRIILTREGRSALRGPGDDRAQTRTGTFSTGFGPEFERHFRAQYARAVQQAHDFTAFVDPQPGSAVVEVGAGFGRITFDGGLADRVGPTGQLLVTDPSGPQLQSARKRAEELGLDWLRFVRAPAEDLPMASATADLTLGALFLQFTAAPVALLEMARIVRSGGRVAISAGLEHSWPPAWQEALEPVRHTLDAEGLPFRHFFLQPGVLEEMMTAAGLRVERSVVTGPHTLAFPSADLAVGFCRQIGLVQLLLRGHCGDRLAEVQRQFERRVREGFQSHGPQAWSIVDGHLVSAVARRP